MRTFATGATRDIDDNKYDFEGFLSPLVLERYAQYMHKNRVQANGELRASDNWQKGIPKDAYIKSGWRHFFSWWAGHRKEHINEDDLCALLFNVMGYLHEHLKEDKTITATMEQLQQVVAHWRMFEQNERPEAGP